MQIRKYPKDLSNFLYEVQEPYCEVFDGAELEKKRKKEKENPVWTHYIYIFKFQCRI